MTINAWDAMTPPTLAQMKRGQAAGYIAAGIYFTKPQLRAELPAVFANCAATGFKVWLIDEGMGNAAVFARGEAGGFSDGTRASTIATMLDIPKDVPIYFAIDYDAGQSDVANIKAYLAGYQQGAMPHPVGMYADGLIASECPTAVGDYVPGASGWNGTAEYLKSGKVAIIQHPPSTFFGLDADPCEVIDQSVLWQPMGASNVTAGATPAPQQAVAQGQPPQPINQPPPLHLTSSIADLMPDLKDVQAALGVTVDGLYGPETAAAIQRYYQGG